MDFANRGNRPNAPANQQQGAQTGQQNQPTTSFQPSAQKKNESKLDFGKLSSIFMLFTATILAFVLVLGLMFYTGGNKESEAIQTDKYQAIFLDTPDNQVYFGKLGVYNKDVYVLTNIFYIRVANPIQPQGTEVQQPSISLAKLGDELHGPQDVMYISRDKVLYWENLKDDGKVVKAITTYQKEGESTDETSTPTPTPTSTEKDSVEESETTPTETETSEEDASTQPAGTGEENDTPTDPVDPNLTQ